jgi:tetratricopeptide (TPR) repeat protein
LDRDEEALALLSEAVRHIENMHVVRQLAMLQMDLQRYAEAAESLARFAELAPLIEEGEKQWLLRQRVALDCRRGERQSALEGARQIDHPYYHELTVRLESGASYKRVQLEVPFVRQYHLTCAPATLSAISRYWHQPAEHPEVAEAICYDGTPSHSERHWAETNGWIAREFKVTWGAAVALLDRGIPFTLTTQSTTSGHLQAVVGYDELRETLRIRDPFWYAAQEFPVKALLDGQQSSGPRGMALVPANRRELLESLELPESELYDELHAVERALVEHRREQALSILQRMQAKAAAHRLTLSAQRALAAYDGNAPALRNCLEQLLKQYPDDGNLNLARLGCLRELARRGERLALLERLCGQPGVDPIFLQQYARELRADARDHRAATSWVRCALRYRPTDAALVSAWADLLWDRGEHDQALRYYRLAAGLGETQEQFAQSYFVASRHLHQTEVALAFLRDREQRLGRKSANSTITLVESLQHLRRSVEALKFLTQPWHGVRKTRFCSYLRPTLTGASLNSTARKSFSNRLGTIARLRHGIVQLRRWQATKTKSKRPSNTGAKC